MSKISGFGKVSWINDRFGIIRTDRFPNINFTSTSTSQVGNTNLEHTFSVGEKVAYSGEKLDGVEGEDDCNCIAYYVRKTSEILEGTAKIQDVHGNHGILSSLELGQKIFFPGRSFKKETEEMDLTKVVKKGDLVHFLAIPDKTNNGAEMVAIEVSLIQKFPVLVVYQQSGFSVLWSKCHGKIYCSGDLLKKVSKEQSVSPGSWVKCCLQSQDSNNETYWKAVEASKYKFAAEKLEVSLGANFNSFSVSGVGLICAVLEKEAYLWNEFIGRVCFKNPKDVRSAKRLSFASFKAQFQLSFEKFDHAWLGSNLKLSSTTIHLNTVNFGEGEIVDVKPNSNYGFVHVPRVGGIYFRNTDYDGGLFVELKGKKCQLAYVDFYDPQKEKGNRALFVVEA